MQQSTLALLRHQWLAIACKKRMLNVVALICHKNFWSFKASLSRTTAQRRVEDVAANLTDHFEDKFEEFSFIPWISMKSLIAGTQHKFW